MCLAPPVLETLDDIQHMTTGVVSALRQYPHFVVLPGICDGRHYFDARSFVRALAGNEKLSFTRVQIDAGKVSGTGTVTHYSRTSEAMDLHTDSAFSNVPHNLVAFEMVRPDPAGGGISIARPAADVISRLSRATVKSLRQARFPFGKKLLPIIWGASGKESIRYYSAQVEKGYALSGEGFVRDEALQELDAVLGELADGCRFRLNKGDLLLLNNHKALHGRAAFSQASDRLMHRYRCMASFL